MLLKQTVQLKQVLMFVQDPFEQLENRCLSDQKNIKLSEKSSKSTENVF